MAWTQAQADARLMEDANHFAESASRLCPNLANDPARLSAIADFAYNVGVGALRGSTLRKRVLANDWDGACVQLARWVRGGGRVLPGLVARRAAEAELLK